MGVRLILYSASRKQADVNTFKAAANTLNKSYQIKYPGANDRIIVQYVESGKAIAKAINAIGDGKLKTLDIVSHGNQGGIHISRNLTKPEKSGLIKRNAHVWIRSDSNNPQTEEDAEYMEESMHGLYSDYMSKVGVSYYYNQKYEQSTDIAYLDDIRFSVFANDAVVEFHGCRTAELLPFFNAYVKDNFAENFSERRGTKGFVIGHVTNSAPDKNPNDNTNDYRYGRVRVYKDGALSKNNIERSKLQLPNSSTP